MTPGMKSGIKARQSEWEKQKSGFANFANIQWYSP